MVILQQYKGQLVIKNWIEVLLIDPCENKQQNQSAQLQTAAGTALLCSIHNHTSAWDSDSSNPGHFAQVLCMSTVSTMEKRTEKGTFWGAAHKTTRSEQRRKKNTFNSYMTGWEKPSVLFHHSPVNSLCCYTTIFHPNSSPFHIYYPNTPFSIYQPKETDLYPNKCNDVLNKVPIQSSCHLKRCFKRIWYLLSFKHSVLGRYNVC